MASDERWKHDGVRVIPSTQLDPNTPPTPGMDRMAAVDRNLLRASVAEFLGFPKTPKPVVINEALEIARRYSTPESVHFINGVLDSVARELGAAGGRSTMPVL